MGYSVDEYPWYVRCYYADDVEPPKTPGRLAIETVHKTEYSRDIEVEAAKGNPEYGEILTGKRSSRY